MAHTFDRARPAGLSARTAFSLNGLVARISAWDEARRTRAALSRLSTHELSDIGIERSDIERIANRSF